METLPSSLTDKTTGWQKGIAFLLILGVVYGASLVVNAFAPTIIEAAKNIYLLLLMVVPLGLVLLYIIMNPLVIWGIFKTLSWNLTSFLIKMDPLSVMDRYVDYLTEKRANLEKIRLVLEGKKVNLGRMIDTLKGEITANVKKGSAALTAGETNIASLSGTMVATDQETLKMYQPIYDKMVVNLDFLNALSENWKFAIDKLRYTIDRKRVEYTTLKEMAKAIDQASEFANGDTEASKMYNESVKQLEIKASSYVANIEDFEKKSKDIMGSIKVEKQMVQDEGLSVIEEYRKNGSLMLPDFSDSAIPVTLDDTTSSKTSKFGLNK
jgi:hypothetical protein